MQSRTPAPLHKLRRDGHHLIFFTIRLRLSSTLSWWPTRRRHPTSIPLSVPPGRRAPVPQRRTDHTSESSMRGIRQRSEKEEEQEEETHTTHLFFLFPFPIQRLRILDTAKKTREELGGEREGLNNITVSKAPVLFYKPLETRRGDAAILFLCCLF